MGCVGFLALIAPAQLESFFFVGSTLSEVEAELISLACLCFNRLLDGVGAWIFFRRSLGIKLNKIDACTSWRSNFFESFSPYFGTIF